MYDNMNSRVHSLISCYVGGERDKSSLKSYSINSINSFPFSIGITDGDRRAWQPLARIYLPNFILSRVVQSVETFVLLIKIRIGYAQGSVCTLKLSSVPCLKKLAWGRLAH